MSTEQSTIATRIELMEDLENDLIAGDEASRSLVKTILAVMDSAAREQDIEYFQGEQFYRHCELVGLEAEDIMDAIEKKNLVKRHPTYSERRATVFSEIENIKHLYYSEKLSKKEIAEIYHVCPLTITKVLKGLYEAPKKAFGGHKSEIIRDWQGGSIDRLTNSLI